MSNIDARAVIEPGAIIGQNVTIEPYAVIKANVTIKDDCVIKSHVYLDGNTTIGKGTVIWPGASIGTKTQDLKFRGETTYVVIGEHCEIREYVTINASCNEGSVVKIGDHCLLMAYCHVAHNCEVGNHVIMANNSMLAGHVILEDYVIVGGMTPIHQFVRVGRYAMVGGFSRVTHDIPPYTIGAGYPYKLGGLNLVGLKRHGISMQMRQQLTKAFKLTFRSGMHYLEAISLLEKEDRSDVLDHWISFCRNSKRGFPHTRSLTESSQEDQETLEESEEVVADRN